MKRATISVADAMASAKLFAPFFAGPSWDTWRAVIKAMFAEPMTAAGNRNVSIGRRARSASRAGF